MVKRHKDHVDELADRVKSQYEILMKEVPVFDPIKRCTVGDAGLLGMIDGEIHVYEVKGGDDFNKAKKQLQKLRSVFEVYCDVRLFYYSGKYRTIQEVD